MTDFTLCITDGRGGGHALVALRDERLVCHAAAPDVIDGIVAVIERLNDEGATVRDEGFAPGEISISFRLVSPKEPLFLAGTADAFRARAYEVILHDEPRARAWYALHTLPVESEMRAALLPALYEMPDVAVTGLLAELDAATVEFAVIEEERRQRLAALAEADRRNIEELKTAVREGGPERMDSGSRPE
jgi:hypothetical protein